MGGLHGTVLFVKIVPLKSSEDPFCLNITKDSPVEESNETNVSSTVRILGSGLYQNPMENGRVILASHSTICPSIGVKERTFCKLVPLCNSYCTVELINVIVLAFTLVLMLNFSSGKMSV